MAVGCVVGGYYINSAVLNTLDKGEAVAVREARKQIAAYIHGLAGAAAVRAAVNAATSDREIEEILRTRR